MESIRDKESQSSRVEERQSLYRLWFACPVMYAIYSIQCCHLSLTWQLVNALEAHFLRLHVRVMSWGKCARFASNCITPHTHYALRIRTLGQGRKCLLKASLHASKRSRRNRKSMCGWPEPGQARAQDQTRPEQGRPGWRIKVSDSLEASHCNGAHAFPVSPFKLCYHWAKRN